MDQDNIKVQAAKLQSIEYEGDYTNLIFAWLTFRGIKPVSEIDLSPSDSSTKQLVQWFDSCSLRHKKDTSNPEFATISNDPEKTEIMSKIFRIKYPILELIKCELFGFPKESGYAYLSQKHSLPESKKDIRAAKTADIEKNFTEYWKPYIQYIMRQDHIYEDSLVAKLWFDTCALEIPIIHQKYLDQYEKDKVENLEKQRQLLETLNTINDISSSDKESLKQVCLRNSDSGWIEVNTGNKQTIVDWLKKARIQNETDAGDENLIYFTTNKDNIDAFREINVFSSEEARFLRQKYFS